MLRFGFAKAKFMASAICLQTLVVQAAAAVRAVVLKARQHTATVVVMTDVVAVSVAADQVPAVIVAVVKAVAVVVQVARVVVVRVARVLIAQVVKVVTVRPERDNKRADLRDEI